MNDEIDKLMKSVYYKFEKDWCIAKKNCGQTDCSACQVRLEAGWIAAMKQVKEWLEQSKELMFYETVNGCIRCMDIVKKVRDELELLGENK